MSSLGLQARDFHLFDSPIGDQGCCILPRQSCILLDMCHIRGIITSRFMLVMLPREDRLSVFLGRFKSRIGQQAAEDNLPALECGAMPYKGAPSLIEDTSAREQPGCRATPPAGPAALLGGAEAAAPGPELPFELRALAICLDEVAADVASSSFQLTSQVVVVVNKLAVLVRMDNLDRLKKLKQRLFNLSHQVQTLCSCCEGLLDDEEQVQRLCLTATELRALNRFRYYQDLAELSEEAARNLAQAGELLASGFMHFNDAFDALQELYENIAVAEAVVRIKLDTTRNRLLSVMVASNGVSVINAFIMGMLGFFNVNLLPSPGAVLDNWGWSEFAYSWRGEPPEGAGVPDSPLFMLVMLTTLFGSSLLLALLLWHLVRRGIMHL